ncbi:hypothetical protein [Tuwongella immobilis]|uniref:Uncharacterized protein n=1 Tax=Tuwongella immobilis TaxID=692036 RepID=A0A6C2YVZ3_9BACT|nr:hypothetical protein [Tuwongella immobilis]VIP05149.1 Uncharacterized protein OS=Comamonas testosteroni S44 GN=CTS44_18143 PE=4 SV=1 [Tuwongella immobilis]VTS07654.1 Uncharacterized protein OS=Comamonas testosteroni S44 GN=CTS44_18143 PE=4 SV=1 [Tuwongella immobilis]
MIHECDRQRFEQALESANPAVALDELATALQTAGMGQLAMYRLFAHFQQQIPADDPRYDAILDQMDLIWGGGWAKGRARFETELTSADLAEEM